ncbi:MAG TPA: NYN domain-containing protein [Planctomycetota bacterium]|nr:NYN domain-containing protein [Planctomycetota bacterium]
MLLNILVPPPRYPSEASPLRAAASRRDQLFPWQIAAVKRRHALLLDGGFVLKRLRHRLGRSADAADVQTEWQRIGRHPLLADSELLRVFYYDAPPAVGTITNPFDGKSEDLARTPQHAHARALHDRLALLPDTALRMGETVVRGWHVRPETVRDIARRGRSLEATDLRLVIEQKGVDLRIGLDIARLSLLHLVDAVVVVTADRDLVPAFRFARREGLRLYLDHLGSKVVHRDLIAHADRVL